MAKFNNKEFTFEDVKKFITFANIREVDKIIIECNRRREQINLEIKNVVTVGDWFQYKHKEQIM